MTPKTKHQPYLELLALRLYDELSREEERGLAAHLQECAACRSFEQELGAGLGSLENRTPHAPEMPGDWVERLRRSVDGAERERVDHARPIVGTRLVLGFAAGLAAGLLLAGLLNAGSPQTTDEPATARFDVAPFMPRSEPPPRASTRGTLAHLGAWLER